MRWFVVLSLLSLSLACGEAVVEVTPVGDPAGGDPGNGSGDTTSGDPVAGDPTAGDPGAGDPTAGDPVAGDPTAGDPTAGDPTAGDPATGDDLGPPPTMPVVSGTTPASPADDNAPRVDGTADADVTIEIFTNNACSGSPTATGNADSSGDFSIAVSVTDDTSTEFWAHAVNTLTSACSTTSAVYVEDSLAPNPPDVTGTSPVSPANDNGPFIEGTCEADATVTLYDDSSCTNVVATGTAAASGDFSVQVTVTDDTTTTFWATATDAADNTSICSTTSATYEEISSLPAVPSLSGTTPVSPASDNNPTIDGSADANITIDLYTDNTCSTWAATGTTNGTGDFSIAVTVVDDTTTSYWATATDLASNSSSCSSSSATYVEDSTNPDPPAVTSVSPTSPANNNAPVVDGTAEDGTTVTVYIDDTCTTAAGSAASDGSFAVTVSVGDDSTTTFYADAIDAAGNTSTCSTTFVTYIEDSIFPAPPDVTGVSPTSPANDNDPIVSGTAESGATVRLHDNDTCTSEVASGASDGSFAIAANVADNSTTTFYANATDAAGNTSACSTTFVTYVEDSMPPGPPRILSSTPGSPANNNDPTINGTGDNSVDITLFSDDTCTVQLATGTSSSAGAIAIPINVGDNTTTEVYGTATDAIGNESACSVTFVTYVEDSLAPTPAITGSTPASPANENNPAIEGTTSEFGAVSVWPTSDCSGPPLSSPTTFANTWWVIAPVGDNTTTSFSVIETDAAGNPSSCVSGFSYVEDSIPPGDPTLVDTTPASPASDDAPFVNGTAEANAEVTLYFDSGCATPNAEVTGTADGGGNFSIQVTVPRDTTTDIYAVARDAAGNGSACVGPLSYTETTVESVYVSGIYTWGGFEKAALWQDSGTVTETMLHDFSDSGALEAGGIDHDGTDLYTVSVNMQGSDTPALYWMNTDTTENMLPAAGPGYRTIGMEVATDGGTTYLLGVEIETVDPWGSAPVLWDNSGGSFVQSAAGDTTGCNTNFARDFDVNAGNIYVVGMGGGVTCPIEGPLWINGTRFGLPSSSSSGTQGSAAHYFGNTLYIGGTDDDFASYWVDVGADGAGLTQVVLDSTSPNGSWVEDIASDSSTVYAVGFVFDASLLGVTHAQYWVDAGTPALRTLPMPAGVTESNARAVYLYDGDIYISGDYRDSAGDDWVCYWQDDGTTVTRSDLASTGFSGAAIGAEGRGIWVGVH